MRILLLVETLTIGGLPNYVLELARACAERGHSVALAHGGGVVPEFLDCRGVTLLPLTKAGLTQLGAAEEALAALQVWRPDLLHLHLCSDLPLLRLLPRLGVPLLRSFHDYTSMCLRRGRRRFPGDRCQKPLGWSCALQGCLVGPSRSGGRLPALQDLPGKLEERAAYQAFSASVVGSRHMSRVLLLNGFTEQRVRVVPYFSRFDQQALGVLPMGDDKHDGVPGRDRPLHLLFTGQAVKGKGLEVLVRALAGVQGDWRLVSVSSGPRLPAARALAQRLGIAERIEFIEWLTQERLAGYYRRADLFVLPSVWDDPGPLVGIEAMAFETPVLAFPVGGIPDYVLDGRTGFLTRSVSAASLTETLQRAMDEASSLVELGREARSLVARNHTRSRHLDTLLDLYKNLISVELSPGLKMEELFP
ncbi:glycosyltransferase family 4 protein [Pseudomonas sp. Gutcm_11s]|uniref:glycosyltransferase family 4 protein n=1 Tax=Pseudomonas sp. Gutcm_11s TaxID=3026088 RepID=UPI0023625743|nr:glycosyltransferase family 4 protein [Pseudomonas sp. Gutcm_11s]MDD0841199.1 glycosyltransferase family 4 protein [Pseudomonas sp. Gutcm_11s]